MMIPLATIGNLFGMDMWVIFLVVLLMFGAKKLPELARGLGQSLNEFKKAREDFEHEIKTGQQEGQAPREALNKQAFGAPAPAVSLAKTLPYDSTAEVVQAPAVNEQLLQQQVEQLQEQLRALQQQKEHQPHVG